MKEVGGSRMKPRFLVSSGDSLLCGLHGCHFRARINSVGFRV